MINKDLSIENSTLGYYHDKATEYTESTLYVDFSEIQEWFTSFLEKGNLILDFGCGAGRDSLSFLNMGYKVEAMDGSTRLCAIAEKVTNLKVKNVRFSELNEKDKYDGIWACASIVHVSLKEINNILNKMHSALKKEGVVYCSFKYGKFEGIKNGRYYTYFTEEKFNKLITNINLFNIVETRITSDVRKERNQEKWLNVILKKLN